MNRRNATARTPSATPSTARPLSPLQRPPALVPAAAALHAALVLVGCRRAPSANLAPDPQAESVVSTQTAAEPPATFSTTLKRSSILPLDIPPCVMGYMGPRAVPAFQPISVTLQVLAPDVEGAQFSVRNGISNLRACTKYMTRPSNTVLRLRVDVGGSVTNAETDAAPDEALAACLREALSNLEFPPGRPWRPPIRIEIDVVPSGPLGPATPGPFPYPVRPEI